MFSTKLANGLNQLDKMLALRCFLATPSGRVLCSYYSAWPAAKMSPSFHYVIVGAGSAGCVLANRLSENKDESVLLLEAGPKDLLLNSTRFSWKIHMPAALTYNLCNDKYNWFYHTTPQRHMDRRVMYWPRGRVWGGSSSLNAMVYIRGHAEDYNRWHREGATGWNYEHCLPYFKKAQTHELGADRYRGGSGPLHVSRGKTDHPLHHAFIQAGQQAGYPFTDDMNGYQQEGVGWMDMTIYKGTEACLGKHDTSKPVIPDVSKYPFTVPMKAQFLHSLTPHSMLTFDLISDVIQVAEVVAFLDLLPVSDSGVVSILYRPPPHRKAMEHS